MSIRGLVRIRGLVQMLIEELAADPARLRAVAAAARARHGELARQGEPPRRLHPYLVAAALAGRGLAMIREAAAGHALGGEAHTERGSLPGRSGVRGTAASSSG